MKRLLTVLLCLMALQLFPQQTPEPNRIDRLASRLASDPSLHFGPVDLNLGNMLRLSQLRGLYLGVHLSTNDRLSPHFRLTGYGGYWTRLHIFDYGAEGKWFINPGLETELGARYAHKSVAMGEFGGFDEGVGILAEEEYRYTFYENILTRGNFTEVFFNTCFARHFKGYLTAGVYDKGYFLPTGAYGPPDSRHVVAEAKLRFDKRESHWPVVWVAYQHAFKGVLGGEYEYDRVKLQVAKDFHWRGLGTSSALLQTGFASSGCPVEETFGLIGSYMRFGLYAPGCFATMREDEFFCDRFVALFLSHDFEGSLWNLGLSWFQPHLSLVTNMGWGLPTMDAGYYESGLVVRGLLVSAISRLGLGVFYRYGPYAFSDVFDNFAFKWTVTFGI